MATYEQMIEKYFTEEGYKSFSTRLKSFVDMYNTTPVSDYPIQFRMFGFPMVEIKTQTEILHRIKELGELTGQITKEVMENAN